MAANGHRAHASLPGGVRPWLAALLAVVVAGCGSVAPSPPTASSAPSAAPSERAPVASAGDATAPPPAASPSAPSEPAPSSAPSASAAAPSASAPPKPFGFEAKGMTHEVIAFATVPQLDYVASRMDLSAVSTIAYFGLTATAHGRISLSNGGGRAWTSARMDAVIARAHAAGTRVVATIGRFAWTAGGRAASIALLASRGRRERLARTIARLVIERGVDGVDLDFEPIPAGLADEHADLVARVRRALDAARPGLQLTVALVGHFDSYDVAAIARGKPDAIYLMGYHYAGWWSKVAASTAPLGGPRYDLADTVGLLRRSVPAERIIVGVPYYGHLWPTKTGQPHARTTGRGSDLSVGAAAALAAEHGLRWDPVEHVAWSRWRVRDCASCAAHWVELYFDSPRASRDKWAWVKRTGLLGTGIWTIGFEGDGPGPWNAELRRAFLR
ncbi:MAG TPA: glycoside hydrolase family 18 protein [Candidatus Limnocylindrales bacterium]|nr:glycoside hydrolase family 18 protein [Candidatus Limnocylindrales bacterium]